jgi:hypothetical protein
MRSPLRDGHEQSKDSTAAAEAWKNFKLGYMQRKEHPATGKPIDAEYNKAEYDREKNEFYYDTEKGKLRLIPTDDGEQPIMDGIQSWQLAPSMKSKKIVGQDTGKVKSDKKGEYVMHGKDTIRPADNKKFRPFVQGKQSGKMESGYLSDDNYTIKDGRLNPIKKSPLQMVGIQSPLNKISGPCKAAAKRKFKVWPSAYASGWGVRCTKAGGPSNYGGGKKK